MKKLFFIRIVMIQIFLLAVSANAEPKIYQDYEFGMSKKDIMKNSEVYDCSKEFEKGALCLSGEEFADEDVDIAFRFVKNRLVSVALISEFSNDSYINFIGAINSKFQMCTIANGSNKIDLIVQIKQYEKSESMKYVADFEQRALANGYILYTFITKDSFKKFMPSSSNTAELIAKSDDSVRTVDYMISDTGNGKTINMLQFSLPKESMKLIQGKSANEYSDF